MTLHRGALFAVSFYAGLGTMAFEMVLGRALVPYFGGTICTTFFLVPYIGSRAIFSLLGVLPIACAAGLFAIPRARGRAAAPAVVALVAAILCTQPGAARAQVSVMAPDGVIEKVESEYNNVFVIKQGQMLYMNFGYRNSQYVESAFDML